LPRPFRLPFYGQRLPRLQNFRRLINVNYRRFPKPEYWSNTKLRPLRKSLEK
jgi:hypothetical protein